MKFIHTADIHLDSPLIGLERYEGAPVAEIRGATRQAFRNLLDLAISEGVAFVLIAGDLYDGDWKDYNTGLFFAAQMAKLREAGIPVFIIAGNHDASSQITKHLCLPDNVRLLSSHKPESVILDDIGVTIHGQGFHSRVVTEDLSLKYPEPLQHYFNIGLLHTSADGREGHQPYAPCSVQGLLSKGYDYWALGHVHKYEVLHRDPWILFSGNIQGRHVRETGPKGCTLVTVEDGKVISAEHRDLDILRWSICAVDGSNAMTGEDVVDRFTDALNLELTRSDGRFLAVRVEIFGGCKAHGELHSNIERWINEIRASATGLSAETIWIEKVKLRTQSETNLDEMAARNDAIGGLLRAIRDLDAGEDILADMTREFADLQRKLPFELRAGEDAIDLESPATLHQSVEDVKEMLLDRLLRTGKVT